MIEKFKSFQTVCKEGSFKAAANKRFLTQPALSSQIKQLEEYFQCILLVRHPKGVTPTAQGELLLESIQNIQIELKHLENKISSQSLAQSGNLHLAASDTISRFYLAPMLATFLEKHPEVHITVSTLTTPEIIKQTQAGECDLGFVLDPKEHKNIRKEKLFEFNEIALCKLDSSLAQKDKLTLKELVKHRLLVLPQYTRSRQLLEIDLQKKGIILNDYMEVGNTSVAQEFVRSGLGVAIIPDYAIENTELHSLKIPLETRSMFMCFPPHNYTSPVSQAFQNWIK